MSSSPPPDNAPTARDLDALEAKAKNALTGEGHDDMRSAWDAFSDACDPDTVLELIRLARRLEQAFDYLQSCLLDASKTVPPEYDAFTIRRDWFASISENAFHIALGSPGEEGEPAE